MADHLYGFFLLFSNPYLIVCIGIIGFIFIDQRIFGLVLLITTFSMALNPYLKILWHVPLNPELQKEGFAFPSGHTQNASVFWFMLALQIGNNNFTKLCILLMAVCVSAIFHFRFHDWPEIAAGFSFAGIIVIFFHYLLEFLDGKKIKWYNVSYILVVVELCILFFLLKDVSKYSWLVKPIVFSLVLPTFISMNLGRYLKFITNSARLLIIKTRLELKNWKVINKID
jgi:hypothetical protein